MFILSFDNESAIDRALTGGKGASLASMKQAGFPVPDGFVILQSAFADGCLTEQAKEEIASALAGFSESEQFAVRSSATAEDGSAASFAGMFESLLDVSKETILSAIVEVYASSQSERVREYAKTQGFDQIGGVAVVVQQMVAADIAGVLFTADPQTSDRFTTIIEAVEGLGDALVSGRKTPETWRIREGEISGNGKLLSPDTLSALSALGKKIALHYDCPQDIEWCVKDDDIFIVQSRPITTLFPLPKSPDGFKRCFTSAGHIQMMTDAILPLGMSLLELVMPFKAVRAGGHLFIDVTHDMQKLYGRFMLSMKFDNTDPLMAAITKQVIRRRSYIASLPKGEGSFSAFTNWGPLLKSFFKLYKRNDPADLDTYEKQKRTENAALAAKLHTLYGTELLRAIEQDQQALTDLLYDPTGFGAVLVGQYTTHIIDRMGKKLLGNPHITNYISKSVEHNVTSQMGLALSDVADAIRPYPEVIAYLESGEGYHPERLSALTGGKETLAAMEEFLKLYGMRCTGEIDITRTRFNENPSELFPALLSNLKTLPHGHGKTMFEKGRLDAQSKIDELVALCAQRYGRRKAEKLTKQIDRFRNFVGAREYPKYFWICRYDVYKKQIMKEAYRLVQKGVLKQAQDVYYLYWEELREAVGSGTVDEQLLEKRKKEYQFFQTLNPPRVIFSDGEVPPCGYDAEIPLGALPGLAVSSGVVTGRARVIDTVEDAHIEKGDILVTKFTDPSWTPVFVSIAALVTEVGGMMTHGSVITREYGLPAVVGVVDATKSIKDGDIIRVDGDKGYVEIIDVA